MKEKIDFFENGDYKFVTNIVNEKLPILRGSKKFEEKYLKLYDIMEQLEDTFNENQKEMFNELIKLFYETEEYYCALAYSLGIKYGNDLNKI